MADAHGYFVNLHTGNFGKQMSTAECRILNRILKKISFCPTITM